MSGMREATISALQGAQLSRHLGRPTHNAIKTARKELGIIYVAAKTTHQYASHSKRIVRLKNQNTFLGRHRYEHVSMLYLVLVSQHSSEVTTHTGTRTKYVLPTIRT